MAKKAKKVEKNLPATVAGGPVDSAAKVIEPAASKPAADAVEQLRASVEEAETEAANVSCILGWMPDADDEVAAQVPAEVWAEAEASLQELIYEAENCLEKLQNGRAAAEAAEEAAGEDA
jgi:hypothetical protein